MTTPVVVAVDPQQPRQAHDAVTTAARLADPLKAPLQAVQVFVPCRGELGPQVRQHAHPVNSALRGSHADAEAMVHPGASPAVKIVPRLPDPAHEVALAGGMETALDAQTP